MLVSTVEAAARSGAVVAFLAGTIAGKRRDWAKLARGWERDGWDQRAFDAEITDVFTDVVRHPLRPLLSSAFQLGRRSMATDAELDVEPGPAGLKAADAWAGKYAEVVATDLASTNATVVHALLPDWLSKRLPVPAMAARAKEIYGLDARSAAAFTSYANSEAKRKDLRGLGDRYLENRAQVAADVHTFTALNTGRQQLLTDGIAQGFLRRNARKVWVTAIDERVCEVCGPMDGVAVEILKPFTVVYPPPRTERGKLRPNARLLVPPVHPNCRCTVVLDKKFTQGIITRTARFSDSGPRHLARLTSRAADLVLR